MVRPSAILLRPRLHDASANEADTAGDLRGSARTVRELELAHAWRGSGCGLGAWVHVQVGAGSSASSGASSAAAFTTMPEQTSHPTVPPHCAARVPASTDLFDELATPVKSAAPMHTIDIVRMPAGRPAHPRSTPITEPRTAASSKLTHSCSSSAKMIPPRNRCNAWVRCGNLPVSLRRGGPVLENRKRGEWLLATPAASTTSSMTRFKRHTTA